MSKATIVCVVLIGCATGGNAGSDASSESDAAMRTDARTVTTPDAAVRLDAGVTPDAHVSQTPDAAIVMPPDAGSSGPFCSSNSQCTVSGECCVTLGGPQGFCAPGTVVFGECVPET